MWPQNNTKKRQKPLHSPGVLWFLYKPDGSKRVADNALVSIILMIAESKPQEKDIIVSLGVNLINQSN